jgi:hypothetical protein
MKPPSCHFPICVAGIFEIIVAAACFAEPDTKVECHQEAFAPIRLSMHNTTLTNKNIIPKVESALSTVAPEKGEQKKKELQNPVPTEKKIIYSTMPIIAPDNSKNYAVQYWNPPADKNYTLRVIEVEVINPQESDQKQK